MKKIYLTIIAMLFAAVGFAQKSIIEQAQLPEFLRSDAGRNVAKAKHPKLERRAKGQSARKSIMKSAPFDLITEQPEGELKTFVGTLGGYYSIMGYILPGNDYGRAVDMVYGDNGLVYIKDPFCNLVTDTWLKGFQKGDTITVMAQPIYYEAASDGYDETVCYACKMYYGYSEDYGQDYWMIDTENELKMVVRNDSIIMENDHGFSGLGLFFSDGKWTGFGEYRKILTPQTDTAVALPAETEEPESYVMTYGSYETGADTLSTLRQIVTLTRAGNDVYLSDLTGADDGLYAKGTLADGKLTVKSGQYMGVAAPSGYNAGAYHDYLEALGWKTVPTYGNALEDSTYFIDQITFDYDEATRTFTGENQYLSVNGGNGRVSTRNGFKQPVLSPHTEVKAAPAKPTFHSVEDVYDTYQYSYMELNLTNSTEAGEFLDTRRIYYNIYVDDEQLVFYPDEYVELTEAMEDVPYGYVDNEDFQTYKGRRVVYFFMTDFSKLVVQEYYLDTDGVKHYSDYDVWAISPDGISQTAITGQLNNVQTVSYYDLSGRAVSKPERGIYLQVAKYADGSVKTQKVILGK